MTQIAPDCWAPRESVVAFLCKRDVDRSDMPSAWLKDLPGDAAVAAPDEGRNGARTTGRRGDVQDYDWDEAKMYALKELNTNGDMEDPQHQVDGWRSQADLTRKIMTHLAKVDGKEPAFSTAKAYVSDFYKEWRSGRR